MASVEESLRSSRSRLWLSYFWAISFSLPFSIALFISVSPWVYFDGESNLGIFAQLLLLGAMAYPAWYCINKLVQKRKSIFAVEGHQLLIAHMARHLSLDYAIHSLADCAVTAAFMPRFVGTSTYVAYKDNTLGLLVVRTKSGSKDARVTFTPINIALGIIVSDMRRARLFRKCVSLESVFSNISYDIYADVDFEVPHKQHLLKAAISLNAQVAKLTRIEGGDLISMWLDLHLPANIVARRLEDIDIGALLSLYTKHKKAYIPSQFFIGIARAYIENPDNKYPELCAHWVHVFVTSLCPKSPQYSWPNKNPSADVFLALFENDMEPKLEGYAGERVEPNFVSMVVKMIIDRLGLDSTVALSDAANLGYRYLYGTEQALEKYPDGKRLYLKNDLKL
jgi:hypothetical protein